MPNEVELPTTEQKAVTASEIIAALCAVETWITMYQDHGGRFDEEQHRSVSRTAARIRHLADEMTE
jgi:hypothetical protein